MLRLLTATLIFASSVSFAATDPKAVIERWYVALAVIDRTAFESLLADDAVISLDDLDTEQTKKEFIESLDEWQDAMKGTTILHKIESETSDSISVLVCYKFPDNETLGRETFKIEGGAIKESVQTTIAETCADY